MRVIKMPNPPSTLPKTQVTPGSILEKGTRREFAQNGVKGLSKNAPSPAPTKTADQRRIEQLEKQNSKLAGQLETANDCLDLQ